MPSWAGNCIGSWQVASLCPSSPLAAPHHVWCWPGAGAGRGNLSAVAPPCPGSATGQFTCPPLAPCPAQPSQVPHQQHFNSLTSAALALPDDLSSPHSSCCCCGAGMGSGFCSWGEWGPHMLLAKPPLPCTGSLGPQSGVHSKLGPRAHAPLAPCTYASFPPQVSMLQQQQLECRKPMLYQVMLLLLLQQLSGLTCIPLCPEQE